MKIPMTSVKDWIFDNKSGSVPIATCLKNHFIMSLTKNVATDGYTLTALEAREVVRERLEELPGCNTLEDAIMSAIRLGIEDNSDDNSERVEYHVEVPFTGTDYFIVEAEAPEMAEAVIWRAIRLRTSELTDCRDEWADDVTEYAQNNIAVRKAEVVEEGAWPDNMVRVGIYDGRGLLRLGSTLEYDGHGHMEQVTDKPDDPENPIVRFHPLTLSLTPEGEDVIRRQSEDGIHRWTLLHSDNDHAWLHPQAT